VPKATRDRIEQKAQEKHERDMNAAQHVRRHDAVGGIQVEKGHDHRDRGDERAQLAA
jgi:hypothetical protein